MISEQKIKKNKTKTESPKRRDKLTSELDFELNFRTASVEKIH